MKKTAVLLLYVSFFSLALPLGLFARSKPKVKLPRLRKMRPVRKLKVKKRTLAKLPSARLLKNLKLREPLSVIALVHGKKYGAASGKIGLLGKGNRLVNTVKLPFKKVAGLSSYKKGSCLVGKERSGSVFTVNLESKKARKLFSLKELRTRGVRGANLVSKGRLSGLAYDGRGHVFVSTKNGYSSSIFKVQVKSKKVVVHSFAPGPTPAALQYVKGKLYVVDERSGLLRTYDRRLNLSSKGISIPVKDAIGVVIQDSRVEVLSPKKSSIVQMTVSPKVLNAAVQRIRPVKPELLKVVIPALVKFPRNFAVLICGDVAESGYNEFWNDTVWMYKMLRRAGYKKANIYVLYGDGADYYSGNPKYRCNHRVTDFPATTTWVDRVFDGMKNGDAARGIKKLRSNDSLFVWTFDHGAYMGSNSAYLCLMDGWMTSSHFANKLNRCSYSKRAIFMQQCYSGGFISALQNSRTYISTACRANETAHRADDENEYYGSQWYCHGEYNYHIISAMDKQLPSGSSVDADSNNDGRVSVREAHLYMSARESQSEQPQQSSGGNVGNTFKLR